MTPIDVLGPDERAAYIASEVVTVLALLVAVALMIGGVQALVWWWTA